MNLITFPTPEENGPLRIPHRRWKDHPVPGTDFPDISPATAQAGIMRRIVDELARRLPDSVEVLAGIDIGGLGLAGALACRNGLCFVDVRKVDSVRGEVIRTISANYDLGSSVMISKANRLEGRSVAILDDVLMTGSTALAAIQLIRRLGASCATALFVYELDGMGGRERLARDGINVQAIQSLSRSGPDQLDREMPER